MTMWYGTKNKVMMLLWNNTKNIGISDMASRTGIKLNRLVSWLQRHDYQLKKGEEEKIEEFINEILLDDNVAE